MDVTLSSGLNILNVLMSRAGWHCNDNRLVEAVPHMLNRLSSSDLVKTLANLGVPTSEETCHLRQISSDDCPALFVGSNGAILAILEENDGQLLVMSPGEDGQSWQKPSRSRGRLIRLERFGSGETTDRITSISDVTSQFRGALPWLAFATFMSNLMGLATPLLIMVIYDKVIPSGSTELLLSLVLVVLTFLAADAGFRSARNKALAHVGRETEQRLGIALFRKLMALPIDQFQKSDVEQQLARFKQFEGFRDVFTGQILTNLLDLPFTIIFFLVLFWLSPPIAYLIVGLAVLFLLASWVFSPILKKLGEVASNDRKALQAHVFEAAKNQQTIQRLGLEAHWMQRQKYLSEQSAKSARLAGAGQLLSQNIGQSLMAIAGVGALCFGALSALDGTLSFGALIAIMSLVWKVLSPLQALYANVPQIFGYLRSKAQSDRILSLPEELVRGVAQSHQKTFEGRIAINGVTHKYDATSTPALSQVSLEIAPNAFAIVCGGDSSGKTTLMNLISGFYKPTIGTMELDHVDVRQIAVDDLRRAITCADPRPELFYGTVFQNFRLATPSLTEDDVLQALENMELDEVVEAFPDGIHTRLSEEFRERLPISILRALALARSFARDGSVLLLNEPSQNLDDIRRDALLNCLVNERGRRTLVVASQDPDIIGLANHVIYLDQGRLVVNDTTAAGKKKLQALLNKARGG